MDLDLSIGPKDNQDSSKLYDETYDLLIIGGGPAGYAAAIYSARFMIKALVVTKIKGGTIIDAHVVENYPGFKSISGMDLMKKFEEQATFLGVPTVTQEIVNIKKEGELFLLSTDSGKTLKAKQILFATGTARRKLNVKNENQFLGKGVSYCATCDAFFFKDKIASVVGGSDAAVTAALLLSQFAKKVYIIYRRDKLRAEPYWLNQLEKDEKIEVIYNANVVEVYGDKFVQGLKLDNGQDLKVDGMFVEIGSVPSTSLANEIGVKTDDYGYILVNEAMETNIKGVYAAGDVSHSMNQLKQVVTAVAGGAIAAESAYKALKKDK